MPTVRMYRKRIEGKYKNNLTGLIKAVDALVANDTVFQMYIMPQPAESRTTIMINFVEHVVVVVNFLNLQLPFNKILF